MKDPEPISAALEWVEATGSGAQLLAAVDRALKRKRRRLYGALASTAVVTLCGFFAFHFQSPPAPTGATIAVPVTAIPATAIVSQPARQILGDGSIVELNDSALISIEFSANVRRVKLVQGEAHFQVAKDQTRPFIVTAGIMEVSAVGTAFSVELNSRGIEVLVTEGRVSLNSTAGKSPSQEPLPQHQSVATLDAGSLAFINLTSAEQIPPVQVASVENAEIQQLLAWRIPRLEFTATPLSKAILLINQYSSTKLVLADSSLESLELSGTLRANNMDSLLTLLATEFQIKADHRDREIILHR